MKLKQMNGVVERVVEMLPDDATLMVMGDHGMFVAFGEFDLNQGIRMEITVATVFWNWMRRCWSTPSTSHLNHLIPLRGCR